MIECHIAPSPLGHLAYRAEDDCLTGLFFVGQKHFPAGLIDTGAPKSRAIMAAKEQVAEYFAGERTVFSVLISFALKVGPEAVEQPASAPIDNRPAAISLLDILFTILKLTCD